MRTERTRPDRMTSIMYLIAAVVFLATALLGDVAEPVFMVLAMAFAVLALVEVRATRRHR